MTNWRHRGRQENRPSLFAEAPIKKGKIMNRTEPITHLFLDEGADGSLYQVTVPVRIAEEIGADDIATWQQFLDAIDRSEGFAGFQVERIDGDERKASARAPAIGTFDLR
jgi:hypothetical protein